MDTVILLVLVTPCITSALIVAALCFFIPRIATGYEDETGFHYGSKPKVGEKPAPTVPISGQLWEKPSQSSAYLTTKMGNN